MLTFLDFYVTGALDKFHSMPTAVRSALGVQCTTDVEAMGLIGANLLSTNANSEHITLSAQAHTAYRLHEALAPFLTSPALLKSGLAIYQEPYVRVPPLSFALPKELVNLFVRARAPNTDAWFEVCRDRSVYLDLPMNTLTVATYDLRAIFLYPSRSISGVINVVSILTNRGSNHIVGRLFLCFGADKPVVLGLDESINLQGVQQTVEHLARLVLLYWLTVKDVPGRHTPLPRISRSASDHNPRKYRAQLKKKTLFTVSSLSPPSDRFGRSDIDTDRSWTLSETIEVAGHFRWVPHGPRNQLRKLNWIDTYQKGDGEQPKPVIHQL